MRGEDAATLNCMSMLSAVINEVVVHSIVDNIINKPLSSSSSSPFHSMTKRKQKQTKPENCVPKTTKTYLNSNQNFNRQSFDKELKQFNDGYLLFTFSFI